MKPQKLTKVLTSLIKNGLPALIKGAPGLGKTEILKVATADAKNDLLIFHPCVDDPTNYKGMPALIDGEAEFLPYSMLKKLRDAKKPTVAFFDDVGQASQAVQSALMQLFLERKINGVSISENVTFIAATNRRTDRAGVRGIITPLISRFATVLTLDPDPDEWISWALTEDIPAELIAFIRVRPNLLHDFDPTATSEDGDDLINQPCPRTIHHFAKLWQAGIRQTEVLEGAVGQAFTTEFLGFLELIEQLGNLPQDIKSGKNPTLSEEQKDDPSVLYALASCLSFSPTEENLQMIMNWVESNLTEEFQMLFFKDLCRKHSEQFVIENGNFTEWARRLEKWSS